MGELVCIDCGARAEGKTFDEADEKIDHGIGLSQGGGCKGDPTRMTWKDKPVAINKVEFQKGIKTESEDDNGKEPEKKSESKKEPEKPKGQ